MSVTSFKEIHNNREGRDSLAWKKTTTQETRTFRAITSSPYDGPGTVLSYADCPQLGAVHPIFPRLYVNDRRTVNHSQSKVVYTVTVRYTSERERSENPLNEPADIQWQTDTAQENYQYDKDGYPCLNSAGDFYAEGIPGDGGCWVATVRKNVDFIPLWFLSYKDAINSDGFVLDGVWIPQYAAKIKRIHIGQVEERNDIKFRVVAIEIKVRYRELAATGDTETWLKRVLDQGLRRLVSGSGSGSGDLVLSYCTDDQGAKATSPMLLDGDGGQLTPPIEVTDAVFNTYHIYNEQPFGILPIY